MGYQVQFVYCCDIRWQSDGMRFDTEAIGDEKAVGGLEGAVSNPVEHEGPKS